MRVCVIICNGVIGQDPGGVEGQTDPDGRPRGRNVRRQRHMCERNQRDDMQVDQTGLIISLVLMLRRRTKGREKQLNLRCGNAAKAREDALCCSPLCCLSLRFCCHIKDCCLLLWCCPCAAASLCARSHGSPPPPRLGPAVALLRTASSVGLSAACLTAVALPLHCRPVGGLPHCRRPASHGHCLTLPHCRQHYHFA